MPASGDRNQVMESYMFSESRLWRAPAIESKLRRYQEQVTQSYKPGIETRLGRLDGDLAGPSEGCLRPVNFPKML